VVEMSFVLARAYWVPEAGPAPVAADFNNTRAIGIAMYTDYVFAVEVAAVLLLVGMVSAISLTLRRRSDVKVTRSSDQIRVRAKDRVRIVKMTSQTEQPEPSPLDNASDSNGAKA
jgi:NADH-quinone oxidoreductase subunit J